MALFRQFLKTCPEFSREELKKLLEAEIQKEQIRLSNRLRERLSKATSKILGTEDHPDFKRAVLELRKHQILNPPHPIEQVMAYVGY